MDAARTAIGGGGDRRPSGTDLVLDVAAAVAFLAIASAMALTGQVSIVLLVAVVVGFGAYAAKFVPGVSYDGPSPPTLGLFFVAIGVLLLG